MLDALTSDRLLTRERHTVEITHNALLRAWPRLRDWITEDRAGNLIRQELEDNAEAWQSICALASSAIAGSSPVARAAW